jgi:hypothetical protein
MTPSFRTRERASSSVSGCGPLLPSPASALHGSYRGSDAVYAQPHPGEGSGRDEGRRDHPPTPPRRLVHVLKRSPRGTPWWPSYAASVIGIVIRGSAASTVMQESIDRLSDRVKRIDKPLGAVDDPTSVEKDTTSHSCRP